MTDYSGVLSRFECLRARGEGRWVARCPAHEDRTPSLSLWIDRDGKLGACCWAGCRWQDILRESGTTNVDWIPPVGERRWRMDEKTIAKIYDYRNANGELLYQVVRYQPKDFRCRRPTTGGGWEWNLDGVERVPYRLPELLADPRQPVLIVEGEKDVDNAGWLGLVATCNSGGAGKWPHEFGQYLKGRRVAVIPDADGPGMAHAFAVAGSLLWWGVDSLRIVELDDNSKDLSDWLCNCIPTMPREKKRHALLQLIRKSREYVPNANARAA